MSELDAEDIARCIEVLRAIANDRSLLAELDREVRRELLTAAGQVAKPEMPERRRLAKAMRKKDRDATRRADEAVLEDTEMRALRRAPVFPTPPALPPPSQSAPEEEHETLREARSCYVCKAEYNRVHFFYDSMCSTCGDFNHAKRNQTHSLEGRIALITGARVKIGYHAAIKLLRAGARVIVTTRFPKDAAERYSREPDFASWSDRLAIYGLDLRHTPSVEGFTQHLLDTLERLDFIVNNACQTVRRPPGFYGHLMEGELRPNDAFAPALRRLLEDPDDELRDIATLFPKGQLDADLQQIDLRAMNSWRLRLGEVSTVELLEVHLVNAVAPFVLNGKLRALMAKEKTFDKHIVNVSAMEGQFYRAFKTDRHPHTNMAKAALNMMTRTSAPDYARDGIYMNSVDTGWITDEDPAAIADKKATEQGATFRPPLDVVDGAARILDPIFDGFITGTHRFGLFFKDYAAAPW